MSKYCQPDRLDHLDRHELRVGALQVAVVLEQHRDPVLEARGADPVGGEVVLLLGDGGGGHPAAVARGRVHGHRSPARADLQQVIVRPEAQLRADALELRVLRLLERRLGRLEQGAGVHHRGVEEQREERVAEVVVRGDVGPGAVAGRCGAPCRPGAAPVRSTGRQRWRARSMRADVAGGDADEGHRVVHVPEPVHVGLGQPGRAPQDLAPHARRVHGDLAHEARRPGRRSE